MVDVLQVEENSILKPGPFFFQNFHIRGGACSLYPRGYFSRAISQMFFNTFARYSGGDSKTSRRPGVADQSEIVDIHSVSVFFPLFSFALLILCFRFPGRLICLILQLLENSPHSQKSGE